MIFQMFDGQIRQMFEHFEHIYVHMFNCSRHLQVVVHEVAEALKSQGEEYG
jgi:hypothetical protein